MKVQFRHRVVNRIGDQELLGTATFGGRTAPDRCDRAGNHGCVKSEFKKTKCLGTVSWLLNGHGRDEQLEQFWKHMESNDSAKIEVFESLRNLDRGVYSWSASDKQLHARF